MNYPKISIVTPVFNQVEYLEETINSVLSQGYPNLEYIIIDGGSTDGTVDIIKRYANQLHYWVSEPDGGMYEAIQKGFEHSTGDIMAWIGSDDMYHPRSFFSVGEIFGTLPQVNWLVGSTTEYDSLGRTIQVFNRQWYHRVQLLACEGEWMQQESCFWRRSLWEKAGNYVDTGLRLAGDYELWVRFSRHEPLYHTDALIGGFRYRGSGQLSVDNIAAYHQEARLVADREPKNHNTERQISRLLRYNRIKRWLGKKHFTQLQIVHKMFQPTYTHHYVQYDLLNSKFVIINIPCN